MLNQDLSPFYSLHSWGVEQQSAAPRSVTLLRVEQQRAEPRSVTLLLPSLLGSGATESWTKICDPSTPFTLENWKNRALNQDLWPLSSLHSLGVEQQRAELRSVTLILPSLLGSGATESFTKICDPSTPFTLENWRNRALSQDLWPLSSLHSWGVEKQRAEPRSVTLLLPSLLGSGETEC